MAEQYLTTKQLAKRWGVPTQQVQYWRSKEIGPHFISLYGSIRYPLSRLEWFERNQLQSFLKKHTQGTVINVGS